MIAGRLNEPIKIFHPTVNYNEFGEANEEYKEVYTTRAKVDHNSGTRTVENNEIVFDYTKTFNVRSYVPVCDDDRIEWQGKMYRILTTQQRREYNDIMITAELINE